MDMHRQMNIKHKTVASWMKYIRNNASDFDIVDRFSECFWESQLDSKHEIIKFFPDDEHGPVYIFGAWFGILAQLLDDEFFLSRIYSIDIDRNCARVQEQNFHRNNIVAVTDNMATYEYPETPRIVINPSTEHVDQQIYDMWWNHIPDDTLYIIQGNNLEIDEHCRLHDTLEDFKKANHAEKVLKESQIVCEGPDGPFYRYTVLGVK